MCAEVAENLCVGQTRRRELFSGRQDDFPQPALAAPFDHIEAVADNFRVNGVGKPADDASDVRLVIVADFDQVEMQQVLARVVERAIDAVAVGIAASPTERETVAAKWFGESIIHVEHQSERRAMRGEGAEAHAFFAGILDLAVGWVSVGVSVRSDIDHRLGEVARWRWIRGIVVVIAFAHSRGT